MDFKLKMEIGEHILYIMYSRKFCIFSLLLNSIRELGLLTRGFQKLSFVTLQLKSRNLF
jgi:hypothetical protein